jgi:hypothetical protein
MPLPELILWFYIIIAVILILYLIAKRAEPKTRGYTRKFLGEPDEIDLRLTYKRFKELYPFSQITYQEYKKLQMERAFKKQ